MFAALHCSCVYGVGWFLFLFSCLLVGVFFGLLGFFRFFFKTQSLLNLDPAGEKLELVSNTGNALKESF